MRAAEAGGLPARAKVNLYLHVTGRRADGYHELDTPALGDEPPAANLAMKAVEAVRRAAGVAQPVALALEKNIPVAAGLGGGSADAAAALRVANELFGAGLDDARLAALAVGLGADVPACLRDVPLAVTGLGERVEPVAGLPAFALVLVNPGVALATAAVFRALAGRFGPALPLGPVGGFEALVAALAARRNDLEAPAMELVPGIAEALGLLRGLGGVRLARMSGSGATCFALVVDLATAETVARAVRRARPHWWCRATVPLV